MPAKLERCVKHVMATGKSKSSSFAICNAAMNKAAKGHSSKSSKGYKKK